VLGEVQITLDVDPNVRPQTRSDRDMRVADAAYAQLLGEQSIINPATGQAWTRQEIAAYRRNNRLVWHHHEDMTTMQLVPFDVNDRIPHDGGRSLRDRQLGFPTE